MRKSTNLGIIIAAIVTTKIRMTLSTYILIFLTIIESRGLLKKGRSSIISKAQRIYTGYDVRAFIQNRILIKIVNPLIGRFYVI